MSSYVCIFGRTPKLSLAEVVSMLPSATVTPLGEIGALVETESPLDPVSFLSQLGGTLKIIGNPSHVSSFHAQILADRLIQTVPDGKIIFGVSLYGLQGGENVATLSVEIKQSLEQVSRPSRFILPKEGTALGSVVVDKQHVHDLVVIATSDGYIIGDTIAVQDVDEWSHRDYDRPYADAKSGMLPIKVSRMIVNVAVGAQATGKTVYDPFCGMGTVIAEALLRGASVIGSDISADVIQKAQKNIDWLRSAYPETKKQGIRLFSSDATHVSDSVKSASVDAVVTEPYMGANLDTERKPDVFEPEKIRNVLKGLEKLYIGCLREWHHILKPRGVIVMAIPKYVSQGHEYRVKKLIDSCEMLGYTMTLGPVEYSRPNATVRREFYKFVKI